MHLLARILISWMHLKDKQVIKRACTHPHIFKARQFPLSWEDVASDLANSRDTWCVHTRERQQL